MARYLAVQCSSEVDRFVTQILTERIVAMGRRIALVEDQHDHPQHDREPPFEIVIVGRPQGDAGVSDLAAGPNKALLDCRRGDVQGACDLCRPEATDRAQGECDLGVITESWVCAHEVEIEHVVAF